MKIVVIGGSGLIGTKLVQNLRQLGHAVVAASRSSGVDTLTGAGLAEAMTGAQVVVDVANSPSWEDNAVLQFFKTSSRNLLAAEAAAGVGHHVALSVVGTERLLASGYFRAKMAQEELIKASPLPIPSRRKRTYPRVVCVRAWRAEKTSGCHLFAYTTDRVVNDVACRLADFALRLRLDGMVELAVSSNGLPLDKPSEVDSRAQPRNLRQVSRMSTHVTSAWIERSICSPPETTRASARRVSMTGSAAPHLRCKLTGRPVTPKRRCSSERGMIRFSDFKLCGSPAD